jgi:hypothetical protein
MTDVVSSMRTRTVLFDGGGGLSPSSSTGVAMASSEWHGTSNSGEK